MLAALGCGSGSTEGPPVPAPDSATVEASVDSALPADTSASDTCFDSTTDAPTPLPDGDATESEVGAPEHLYGVTVDDIAPLTAIVDALGKFRKRPTARIVFDEGQPASYYKDAVAKIGKVAGVMGEILDSQYVNTLSVADYGKRTTEYLDALGATVDLWEVGNEINGEWLGTTSDVVAKASSAFDLVRKRGYRTALTLYWNAPCYSKADHEMFTWTAANIPDSMKKGLDYVLVSYYDDDCPGTKPDWPTVFAKLAAMFPAAKVGIGECGTTKDAAKTEFINRYYTLTVPEPRYVGGGFWWYFVGDMVPATKPLWSVLDATMK